MKASYQFFMVLFICLALYIVRDDVAVVYNKVASYVTPKVKDISQAVNSVKDISTNPNGESKQALVNTPGALKVTTGLVSDPKKVNLTVKNVIDWTNNNRALNGNLDPLVENSKLDQSAKIKLDDMFKQQYFEHVSPDGVGVSDLGDRVSYQYIVIGENLALGNFKDAQSLLDAWMASKGHRANILNTKYKEIGVAVGHGMFNGQDIWLAVQHFGLPRSACPSIDEVLHGQITLEQKQIESMTSDLDQRRARIDSGVVYDGKTTNEQISEYNNLIVTYNALVTDIKNKISEYNADVRAFNSCLSTNTKS